MWKKPNPAVGKNLTPVTQGNQIKHQKARGTINRSSLSEKAGGVSVLGRSKISPCNSTWDKHQTFLGKATAW